MSPLKDASISVARAIRSPGGMGRNGASGIVTIATSIVGR